jgi:RNA polymerase sigma-70 factor (ECF subfamily)
MTTPHPLAEQFEANRSHLRSVAYRILGSRAEAEDAVQEAWLRLSRSESAELDNLTSWLTTVVARLCLDMLRSRKVRSEEPLEPSLAESHATESTAADELEFADSVGLALLVVLDSLGPAERVCFVLHDMFNLTFDEIAPIVGRSPAAARQLASRARRRVRGAREPDANVGRRHEIVEAFLAASREGDFQALLALLDPNVTLNVDRAAVALSVARQGEGIPLLQPRMRGADTVANLFKGRAQAAQVVLIDGEPGCVFPRGEKPRGACEFIIENDRITQIDLILDPESLEQLNIAVGE